MHELLSTLKRGAFALMLAAGVFVAGPVRAQDVAVGWRPLSGDIWVDTWLGDMNRYGARYPEPFIDEMVRYYDVPRPLVVDLLQSRHWAPGDVYFACALATVLGRPCRYVVEYRDAAPGQGWGVVAQRLGVKPGSPEFHRLKRGFVPTYDRWARPIDLDDDLRRDFPNRGKGHDTASHGKSSGKGASDSHGPNKSSKAEHVPTSGKGKSGGHESGASQGKGTGKSSGQGGKKGKGKG